MAFLLYGHPDEHGGERCPPPVLTAVVGQTFIFAQPTSQRMPLEFNTVLEAAAVAATVPMRTFSIEAQVSLVKGEVVVDRGNAVPTFHAAKVVGEVVLNGAGV